MRKRELRQAAIKITDGLLRTVTDVMLFTCFLTLASFGKSKTSVGAHLMFDEAQQLLKEINYDTIKRALAQLKHHRLITIQKHLDQTTLTITKEGKARLQELLPTYKKRRTWDGRIYLVTYDVPEAKRKDREILRSYIQALGGAMLQESVWVIPYNPSETLRSFIEERNLAGVVIVSNIGKDGSIGEENIKDLICRLYKLDGLNERYGEFIENFHRQKKPNAFGAITYLSILRDDPQLPFPLLPNDWLGDKAYQLYEKLYLQ